MLLPVLPATCRFPTWLLPEMPRSLPAGGE